MRSRDYLQTILGDENCAIFVAVQAGEIIGTIHITIRQSPSFPIMVPRRFAVIENLIIVQAQRRSGVGTALMTHAHQWAADQGLTQIELNVWNFNEEAIRFYESLGYETASRRMWVTLQQDAS